MLCFDYFGCAACLLPGQQVGPMQFLGRPAEFGQLVLRKIIKIVAPDVRF